MDDQLVLPPQLAHLQPVAQAWLAVQPWVIASVATLQREVPRHPVATALRPPPGLPDGWVEHLLLTTTDFIAWVQRPRGSAAEQADILARRAAQMVVSLVALFRWAPNIVSTLELRLVAADTLLLVPGDPLASWWRSLLEQVQIAVGAEA